MKTYTYSGETPAEALKKARDEFGDEAMIIQTKEVRKKTLNQPALFELVIGVEDSQAGDFQATKAGSGKKLARNASDSQEADSPQKPQKLIPDNSIQKRLEQIADKEIAQKKKKRNLSALFDDDVTIQLSDTVREISKIAGYPTSMPDTSMLKKSILLPPSYKTDYKAESSTQEQPQTTQKPKDSAKEDSKQLNDIYQEISKLNDKIKLIQNTLWEEKAPTNMSINIPQEFAEIYRIARLSGMNKDHLEEIMRLSIEFMPLKMREQSKTIKRYFREVLRKMIYCRQENEIGKKIIMFVGPTGVGKTTTLAKLAARYSQILEHKKKVGIITLDDYRIGAMEQLAWYARKMRISIDSVSESSDFLNKVDALSYCDYILIDTAGRSQHDKSKINELKRFAKLDDYKIDVALVLQTTTKYEDLKDCYNAFGELNIDTFIFSKLDEARGLGNIFSLVYDTKKPISYLSIGQEVPSDIIVADNSYLADCLLGGFFYPNAPK